MIGTYLATAFIISIVLFFNRNTAVNYALIALFMILQWILMVYEVQNPGIGEYGYFVSEGLGLILLIILSILCVPAFFHSYIYLNKHKDTAAHRAIYFAAITMLITALSAAYLSSHIVITWIFVELTTLSASALIYHNRSARSLEATWKYIFVCSISITLVFIGILFLSIAIRQEGISDLSYKALLSQAPLLDVFWLKLAFLFIFTGFTSKMGLVPMFAAGIDAKDKAPSPAGALISSVLVNVGFLGVFHIYEIISHTSVFDWANKILLIAGILSVFIATVYMLLVKNLKRLLAYSGVEHMGLVILGLASGGIGPYAAILHLVLHSFAKPALFFQVGQINRIYKSKNIYEIGDYFKYNISGALVLLFAYFTVSAMPPSGMFISEYLIFRSMYEAGNLWMLLVVLLLLTLIIWSFGKNIFEMLFIKPVNFNGESAERISPLESGSQFILLAVVVYLGLNPPAAFVDLINNAISNLPNK